MRKLSLFLLLCGILVGFAAEDTAAEKAYQAGQKAMEDDRFDDAIGNFQLCLRLDASQCQAHLGLAATYLALGRDPDALIHLRHYLKAQPDHFLIRWHLAEVLLRLAQPTEARQHLERFLIAVQNRPMLEGEHVLRCHTRLMDVACLQGDSYAEHLHRGIGLLLLAQRKAETGSDAATRRAVEELLCKSAAELTLARLERPEEARPAWYLHRVWLALAQRQNAERWLRTAQHQATPGTLTPAEMAELQQSVGERIDTMRQR
jgi:hypothetical protein